MSGRGRNAPRSRSRARDALPDASIRPGECVTADFGGPVGEAAASVADAVSPHPDGAVLAVIVVPRAGVTAFDRVEAGGVRVRVAASPVDGAANAAVVRFLAEAVDLPRSGVRLLAGDAARRKRVLFEGVELADLVRRLAARLPTG